MSQPVLQVPLPSHWPVPPQVVPWAEAGWVQVPPAQTSSVQGFWSLAQGAVGGGDEAVGFAEGSQT